MDHSNFDRDFALAQLAAAQHGVVSRPQLVDLGLSDRTISRRLERSRLHDIGPKIYAVGHPGISRRGRAVAALLHAGEGAALSHQTAARIWGMVEHSVQGPVHVSVPGRPRLVEPPGIKIHPARLAAAGGDGDDPRALGDDT
jgi:hypothetical protein